MTKYFFQDGHQSKNLAVACKALGKIVAMIFAVPPHNPDLTKNFFHLINVKLKTGTKSRPIQSESFRQFSGRVRRIIMEFTSKKIDKIIDSLGKRTALAMKANGSRMKY